MGPRATKLASLVEKQRGLCALCGGVFAPEDPATVDHIKPVSRGGSDALTNLQAAHWSCNNRRGNMLMETWNALHRHAPRRYASRDVVIDVPAGAEETINVMAARIEFLERANARLHADWQKARTEIAAIQKIVGRAGERGGVVASLQKAIAAEDKRLQTIAATESVEKIEG